MQENWSYIKDSADFINKFGQTGHIPENAILVTADAVGLKPKNALEKRKQKHIPTENLINMAEFVLKFVSNNKFQEQPLV